MKLVPQYNLVPVQRSLSKTRQKGYKTKRKKTKQRASFQLDTVFATPKNNLVFLCLLFTPHKTTCLAPARLRLKQELLRSEFAENSYLIGSIRYTRLDKRTLMKHN